MTLFAFALICLVPPVDGEIVAPFAPTGQYAGHWGVDFSSEPYAVVSAPASGIVTFAGSVAGMRTVTIEPVAGLRVSMSYLSLVGAVSGRWVRRGEAIGFAGFPHGRAGVHMSTRVDGVYVDPEDHMVCTRTDITRALRLVTPPQPYPRSRANRDSRRNIRPHSHRSSARR